MKKILCVFSLSSLVLSNVLMADSGTESLPSQNKSGGGEKSGLFVGAQLGVSILGYYTYNNNRKIDAQSETKAGFNAGLKVGYGHFFTPLIGIRGYLAYDFDGSIKVNDNPAVNLTYQNISLNVDAMVNFINTGSFSMGVFGGFGLGFGIASFNQKDFEDAIKSIADYNGFNIPINLGVSATFASRHKVELGAKIQTLAAGWTLKSDKKSGIYINPYVISVGYSFIF